MALLLKPNLQHLYHEARLASLAEALDDLHDAASEGDLTGSTTMTKAEVVGWLREIVYTAEQTLKEIDDHAAQEGEAILVLLPRRKPR